ncbi:MAG: tetratricopeptide repeat protein [Planctomycetes bacterium]|nr:tetratricopeptide repeat protein [Planctomycetota bacterium]
MIVVAVGTFTDGLNSVRNLIWPDRDTTEETLQKILDTHASERSDWRTHLVAKDDEIKWLREGLDRAQRQADAGDLEAKTALEAARSTGDATGLLKVLEDRANVLNVRVESDTEEFIAVSREIAATAFLVGEIAKAERSTRAILRLRPNDLAAINWLGRIHVLHGELAAAEQHYERALKLANNDAERAVAYGNLGIIYRTRGDLDRAEEMYKKALTIAEQVGLKEGMANQYGNLGIIYRTRGDLDRAEEMHEKSLAIDEQLGRKEGMANQYANLGNAYEDRGDLVQAREYWVRSRDLYAEIGMPHMVQQMQGWIDELSDDADGSE